MWGWDGAGWGGGCMCVRVLTWARSQVRFSPNKFEMIVHQSVRVVGCCVPACVSLQMWGFVPLDTCVSLALCVLLYMSPKRYNRSFRIFLVSFCVIVLNVLSWPRHTQSPVHSNHLSHACLGPSAACPQAVAAICFTSKSHLKVCPDSCALRVSAATQPVSGCSLREKPAKSRVKQIKCYLGLSLYILYL